MEQKEIKLGNTAECQVTGLKGIVIQHLVPASGMHQLAIQPRGDGNTVPDAQFVDLAMLDYVDEGVAARATPCGTPKFTFGEEVREIASDQIGTIVQQVFYLNGCIHYGITCKSQENKNPDVFYISETRIEKVSDGIKEKMVVQEGKQPGGPSIRANTMKARA